MMIGYSLVGTNDLKRATEFYDALLEPLGVKKIVPNDRVVLWATTPGQGMFGIAAPYDGEKATVGNGVMPAISVDSVDTVKALHAKALELGAHDDGEPGPRGGGQMNFCYVRDLDGNKIAFYAMNKS